MTVDHSKLDNYRADFASQGISLPLPVIRARGQALLSELPSPEQNNKSWPWFEETEPIQYSALNNWPKITIVTPSYNQGQFIEETIRSVLLQNYPNLEYIIIDGGSSDNTLAILKKYSRWISYYHSKPDNGQGQAINQGFSLASGEIYSWINSDDYYLKDTLLTIAKVFMNNKAEFVYGYGLNFDLNKQEMKLVKVIPHLDYFIKLPTLIQPSTFWKSNIHQPIWEDLQCSLDFELWLRLVKGKKRHLIKTPLSVAHVHLDAKTSNPEMKANWEEDHLKIWSDDAHGRVNEWKRITFLHRVRVKLYKLLKLV